MRTTRRPRLATLAEFLCGGRATPSVPRLDGGLALARDKPGLDGPIVRVPLPRTLVLPLVGYRGRALVPRVAIGQRVARGETLAPGLLASADGTVVAIEPRPIAHPAGRDVPCVVVETDAAARAASARLVGGDTVVGTRTDARARAGVDTNGNGYRDEDGYGNGADRTIGDAVDTPADELHPILPALDALTLERLVRCGVGGLGGAGFPTPDKLVDAADGGVRTLVVNGAECEPGIACDEALMAVAADEIVAGALALTRLAGARRCLLAVESDKRRARAALRDAIDAAGDTGEVGDAALRLLDVAPVYPSGAERLLLRLATGIDVPAGERPARYGLLCVNVATARAAHRARLGEPSLERIVTVAGDRARRACNARVTFGTPFADVLDATGQGPRARDTRRRAGGPLSGFDVASERVPVTATTNRIALEPPLERPAPAPCIRCAACSDVCPVSLLPQELLRHARAGDGVALDRAGLDACLECGCCDVVCPASIALTATFRHARGARLDARRREHDAAAAEARFRRREARLATRATATGTAVGKARTVDTANDDATPGDGPHRDGVADVAAGVATGKAVPSADATTSTTGSSDAAAERVPGAAAGPNAARSAAVRNAPGTAAGPDAGTSAAVGNASGAAATNATGAAAGETPDVVDSADSASSIDDPVAAALARARRRRRTKAQRDSAGDVRDRSPEGARDGGGRLGAGVVDPDDADAP